MKGKKRIQAESFSAAALLDWYDQNRRDLPWRRTTDPYAILVSEVMLQQTQVKTVIPYYQRWMEAFPDLPALAAAPEQKVLKLWEGLGYYRRARNLQAAARVIVEKGEGRFPETLDGLLSLPGIGRYTAGALGSIAFGWKLPVVDGNVSRVLARLLGIRGFVKSSAVQKKLWSCMEDAMPGGRPGDFNQSMMELGATVCLPKKPLCGACPVGKNCWARRHGRQEGLPRSEKIESVGRVESAVLIRDSETIWLLQRNVGEWHEGLWALPSVIHRESGADWAAEFNRRFGMRLCGARAALAMHYQVTNHRIELRVFEAGGPPKSSERLRAWDVDQLGQLPIVTAHRRSLEKLNIIADSFGPAGGGGFPRRLPSCTRARCI